MAHPVIGSLRPLLDSVIDYAGLFPPAELDLPQAAANYERDGEGEHAWMLGRFVVPAARLHELVDRIPQHKRPWSVSALIGPNLEDDLAAAEAFDRTKAGAVAWIEARVANAELIRKIRGSVPRQIGIYFEIFDPALLSAVRDAGCRAKLRTGGAIPEAIPSPKAVAQFIHAATSKQVAFKCTAGLHHAIRAEHRLTYRDDSPRAVMHGFLNLLLTATLARAGVALETLVQIVEEKSAGAFRFEKDRVSWRDHAVTCSQIEAARRAGFISFGSCSFVEPVGELRTLELI